MDSIDFLEHGGAGPRPFTVRHHGQETPLADPRDLHYQVVLVALALEHVPDAPADIPEWKRALVFDRWRAAWALPEYQSARRLAYLVDNYRAALTHDLLVYTNLDLGEEWRARRWQRLLDVIDRLPAHSWYAATVAQDPEHAKMLADSLARQQAASPAAEDKGPSLTSWSPEVAVLTSILDATRSVQHAVIAAQHGKKAGEPPKPSPRPQTELQKAMKRAEYDRRKAAHESLVARVLPHKRPPEAPVH